MILQGIQTWAVHTTDAKQPDLASTLGNVLHSLRETIMGFTVYAARLQRR